MKKFTVFLTAFVIMAALIAGCGANKADEFNDYFTKVSKNMESLKRANEEYARVAAAATKADDLKGIDRKLADGKTALQKVLADYKATEEPPELTKYKEAAINNFNKRMEQYDLLQTIIGYINKGDTKNQKLYDSLNKLAALEKEINDNDKSNAELLKKIAADNKLTISTGDDKTLFKPIK